MARQRGDGQPSRLVTGHRAAESDFTSYNLCPPPDALHVLTFGSFVSTGLPATPPVNVYTDTVNSAGQKFYRIKFE